MKKNVTYVVAVDGKEARILAKDDNGNLKLVHDIPNKYSPDKQHGRQALGRVHKSTDSSRHSVEPVDEKTVERIDFAGEITSYLHKSYKQGQFGKLVVVAPSKMLGDLRGAYGKDIKPIITAEIAKDYAHLSVREIQKHIEDELVI